MSSWKTTNPSTRDTKRRLNELIDLVEWPKKPKHIQVRQIGPVTAYAQHWIKIRAKTKDSKKEVEFAIPKICLNYNAKTDEYNDSKECPYCKSGDNPKKDYLANFIVRSLQDDEPRKKPKHVKSERKLGKVVSYSDEEFHIKDMSSKSWTPVRVMRLPITIAGKLKDLGDLNKVNTKKGIKTFDIDHPKYGRDISIKFDKDAKGGGAMYDVQKEDKSPLTEEELEYLLYNLSIMKAESLEEAKREFKNLKPKMVNQDSDEEEEDVEEDEESFDEDEDIDEEDEIDMNKKKKKSKKKKRRDEEEDEDSDDEEEEKPRKKKKKKSKYRDEDEDDLDDDSDLDDLD